MREEMLIVNRNSYKSENLKLEPLLILFTIADIFHKTVMPNKLRLLIVGSNHYQLLVKTEPSFRSPLASASALPLLTIC